MKSLKPLLIVVGIVGITIVLFLTLAKREGMVTLVKGNFEKKPIDIVPHHYQDSQCGMVIDNLKYASQVIADDGRSWFFHDHGGMIKWLEERPFRKSATIWVRSIDTKRWIDGRGAYYTRDEETPMKYGFGAYENRKGDTIPFEQMRLFTLRGETMENPTIRRQLLQAKREKNGDY